MSLAREYLEQAGDALHSLMTSQADNVSAAAALVARSWASGGSLLVARTNHTLHEELVYRAGGPVAVAVLDDGGAAYDECVTALPNAHAGDTIIVHSNCGTTAKVISIAMAGRATGAATIALTQLAFETSEHVRSEHPSGARLHELCDVVVDLGGPFGDGVLELPGTNLRVAPISGTIGVAAAWAIIAGAWDLLAAQGYAPLVFQSVQLDGAAAHNADTMARWETSGLAVEAGDQTPPGPSRAGGPGPTAPTATQP